MKDLKNKVAVITGAAEGIGKAIAQQAVQHGMKLALADINSQKLQTTVDEFVAQGVEVFSQAFDVANHQQVDAFAKECAGMGVRVNALLPGFTDTKFASALVKNEQVVKSVLQHVPMNRIAQPNEMAGAVLYLVSPAASYTTGVCLNVDGGYLLG